MLRDLRIGTLVLALGLFACEKKTPPATTAPGSAAPASAQPAAPASQPTSATDGDWKDNKLHRGAAFAGAEAVDLGAILTSPEGFKGKPLQTSGTIARVCTRKGCWMELAAQGQDKGIRITFKDYGFFVPLDSAGAMAKVEGTVKVAELAPERAKHFESEGAKVAKGKDGKYREVQLVAVAVELRR